MKCWFHLVDWILLDHHGHLCMYQLSAVKRKTEKIDKLTTCEI